MLLGKTMLKLVNGAPDYHNKQFVYYQGYAKGHGTGLVGRINLSTEKPIKKGSKKAYTAAMVKVAEQQDGDQKVEEQHRDGHGVQTAEPKGKTVKKHRKNQQQQSGRLAQASSPVATLASSPILRCLLWGIFLPLQVLLTEINKYLELVSEPIWTVSWPWPRRATRKRMWGKYRWALRASWKDN